jgi:uncharacterized membrane protein/YHS domain-containing protein
VSQELIGVFGRLHPFLNHAPIGLLLGLLAIEIVAAAIAAPLPRRVITGLVWITAISAVLAAVSGFVLSRESHYVGETITLHLRLGLAIAGLSVLLAILHLGAREGTRETALKVYRVVLVLAVILLVPQGHLGGTITHGEGFVTEPLRRQGRVEAAARRTPRPIPQDGAKVAEVLPPSFSKEVAPILADRCTACHGTTKKKGGLSLADEESILAGGFDGPVIVAGKAEESEILRRLRLPLDDEDHMPPDHKPQPAAAEIEVIAKWIAAGAPFDAGVTPELVSDGSAALPGNVSESALPANGGGRTAEPEEAPPEALAVLREKLAHVQGIAKDSPLLWIDFAAAAGNTGDAEALALLEPVREQVADLSLARSRITDASMALIARMPNLMRLDLRETEVTDAGVAALAGHKRLAELVLPRTKLTDAAVPSLLKLPALRKVYLWNSGVSIRGIAQLRLGHEDLAIEAGDPGDARPLETNGVFALSKPGSARSDADAHPALLNALCPVTGKPIDPEYQVLFRGRVIRFCCPNCSAKFLADPEKYTPKQK